MASETPKCSDCAWLLAVCEKMRKDLKRLEEENKHVKDLLWKSGGSWADKERAVEEDIIIASEGVVNDGADREMDRCLSSLMC